MGKYDAEWLAGRWPYAPSGSSIGYCQSAPEDQRIEAHPALPRHHLEWVGGEPGIKAGGKPVKGQLKRLAGLERRAGIRHPTMMGQGTDMFSRPGFMSDPHGTLVGRDTR